MSAADWRKFTNSYLIELQRCTGCPPHPLVDNRDKVAHFTPPGHMALTNSIECLPRGIEMFEENHDRSSVIQLEFLRVLR